MLKPPFEELTIPILGQCFLYEFVKLGLSHIFQISPILYVQHDKFVRSFWYVYQTL